MLPTEHQRSSSVVTMAFIGRSVLSLRRNQVVSMEQYHEEELQDLDLFQSYVADRLLSLSSPEPENSSNDQESMLSFSFLHKLLDVFLSCKEEFKDLLARNPGLVAKPPNDRLLADLLDRAVKSLDICNSVTHNIQFLRHWNRHADISATAILIDALPPGEGQLRRAKKALANLLVSFESNHGQEPSRKTERTWSLRCKSSASNSKEESSSRSLLRSWSALKQVQYMSASLSSPKSAESGSGLALAVYTMSSMLVFTMWALLAAFPCQERSTSFVAAPVAPPRQLAWSASLVSLQERIAEEWRKRGKREGLLVEYMGVERIGKEMMDLVADEGGIEIVTKATELAAASRRLEEGLGKFEKQVREVFHRVVASRAEVLKFLEQNTKSAPPFIVL